MLPFGFVCKPPDSCRLKRRQRLFQSPLYNRSVSQYCWLLTDRDLVYRAMAAADTFRETRAGASDGTEIRYSEDQFFEVPQTSIDEMKHPKYPSSGSNLI